MFPSCPPEWSLLSTNQLRRVQLIRTQLTNVPRRSFVIDPPSFQAVHAARGLEKSMMDSSTLIDSPLIVTDQDGIIILVYVPGFISPPCVEKTASAIETLLSPPGLMAPSNDPRHAGLDIVKLDALYGRGRYGLLHCAVWMEQAHADRGPVLSGDIRSNAHIQNKGANFVQHLKTHKEELSLLHAAVCPSGWRRCIDRFRKLQKYVSPCRILSTSSIDPWSSLAIACNLPCHIHRDNHDTLEDLTGLACSGSFRQAFLVLPTLGIKLRYRKQDAVLMNSNRLPHFVEWDADEGNTRYSLSFFNHQDVWDWVKKRYDSLRGSEAKFP